MNKQQTILIVDDDPSSLDQMGTALMEDHRVLFAMNGEDALEIVGRESPDLIVLDVIMPGLGGYEVLKKIKANPDTHDIPIIFLTSKNDEADEKRGLEMGAVDYWTKPFSHDIARVRARTHLELKRRGDLLAELATTDGLTGITNRRGFDQTLEREWRRCSRSKLPLSLIMFDIDHFKAFNDNYGHPAGDECLRRVARILSDSLERPADCIARYGGEEFACILPETDEKGSRDIGRKLLKAIESIDIPHEFNGPTNHVTASAGVSTRFPSKDTPSNELVDLADKALYAAKNGGRNQLAFLD